MTEPPRARSFGHSDRNFNSSLRIRIPTDPDPDPASTPARPPTSGSGCSPRARCKLLGFSRWFYNCGQKLASFFASEEQRVVRILIRSMTQADLAPSPWCALSSRSYGGCRLAAQFTNRSIAAAMQFVARRDSRYVFFRRPSNFANLMSSRKRKHL